MDAGEFDVLYAGAVRRLTGQLYAMTGDLTEAQDVVQEAFVRAWVSRGRLTHEQDAEAWVRVVAWRLAVSRWRRTRNGLVAWRRRADDEHVLAPSEDVVALTRALRLLPEAQRRAVVLHHLCDLSVEQVAVETGAPTGTVKARLARGRAALARHLGELDPDGPERATGAAARRGAGSGLAPAALVADGRRPGGGERTGRRGVRHDLRGVGSASN